MKKREPGDVFMVIGPMMFTSQDVMIGCLCAAKYVSDDGLTVDTLDAADEYDEEGTTVFLSREIEWLS
jgi:hypothetical protein